MATAATLVALFAFVAGVLLIWPRGSGPGTGAAGASHRSPGGPAPRRGPAGVHDVSTGQTWTLGHGRPQAEAIVVKVDILETLLSRYRASGSAVPPADVPIARKMIEDSDNDAATALWYAAGGPARIRAYNAAAGRGPG